MANGYFERGEMYDILHGEMLEGEMASHRPGIIVSSNEGNNSNPTVLVVYTTTTTANRRIGVNHDFVMNGWRNYALCNQIASVSKARLKKFFGKLSDYDMGEIDRRIMLAMNLSHTDETALKEKESEIKDRDVLISELQADVDVVKAEIRNKDEEIASLKMEIEMWQKCYGRCMDMLVDTKVNGDLSRRVTAVEQPKEPEQQKVEEPVDPEEPVEQPKLDINSCTATALKKAGFSLAVARRIVEDRPFESVEDIKGIGGLKSSLYRVLEPKLCCVVQPEVEEDVENTEEVIENVEREQDPGFEKLNLNTCTAVELHKICGMPQTTAYSVTGYRNKNGPFAKVEDLLNVKRVAKSRFPEYAKFLEV